MRALLLDPAPGRPLRLLCIGAHADDLEIGCGGTVRQIVRRHPGASVLWWVVTATEEREQEARAAATRLLGQLCSLEIVVSRLRDGFLPYDGPAVKEAFEALKERTDPDVIFTHCRHDRHQDHRTVAELTWNSWRDHIVLEYEIPKYDADLGHPNFYVALEEEDVNAKLEVLMKGFASQRTKPWYSEQTFRGLMQIRGLECRAPGGLAEAFHAPKLRGEL